MGGLGGPAPALAACRAALAAGDWDAALEALDAAGEDDRRSPEGLELLASAAYGHGDLERTLGAWEDLHRERLAAGDRTGAARAAAMLAMFLLMDTGLMAPVRAWARRAEVLLAGDEDGAVHAWIALVRTYERFLSGDMAGASEEADRAIALGTSVGELPPVAMGMVGRARVTVLTGDLDDGLAQLDDVAIWLTSGELDPLTTGMVWCELICAMQGLAQYDRAGEWTEAMARWGRDAAFGGINGRCRVHRAEMLRIRGPFDAAEDEALRACDELRPWMRREFGWPLNELGNIRLRRGDLEGAEEALLAAHEHAWSPQPGLALLRLAQGRVEEAAELVRSALDHPVDVPSKERPPFGELRRAPLLEAQVEIALAAGDPVTAERAAGELAGVARRFRSRALDAAAIQARGRVALGTGDAPTATVLLSEAVTAWTGLGDAYAAATARLDLLRARRATGDHAAAEVEARAAAATFERLGAGRGVDLVAAALGEPGAPAAAPPAPGGSALVFRRDGDTRVVGFEGTTVLLRDLTGFRYLERLLASPGREFHVLDLVAVERGALPTTGARPDCDLVASPGGDAGPLLDGAARDAYRRRLADIDEDIDEATRLNDPERVARAEADRDYLVRELARGLGLGGRPRVAGATSERARTSVARSLRYARDRLGEHHPELARHLTVTLRTGTYCAYEPDTRLPTTWETRP